MLKRLSVMEIPQKTTKYLYTDYPSCSYWDYLELTCHIKFNALTDTERNNINLNSKLAFRFQEA
jgi:hypothetical protein